MGALTGTHLQTFVGAKDYDVSRAFYVALGWKVTFDMGDLAELELGECRFFLQRYYQKEWCNNMMLHIRVPDTHAWHRKITEVLAARSYGAARVNPPKHEEYGATVTHCWDPSGVLWHLAQPDAP